MRACPPPQLQYAMAGLCLCVSVDLPQERMQLLPCALAGLMLSTALVGKDSVLAITVASSKPCFGGRELRAVAWRLLCAAGDQTTPLVYCFAVPYAQLPQLLLAKACGS